MRAATIPLLLVSCGFLDACCSGAPRSPNNTAANAFVLTPGVAHDATGAEDDPNFYTAAAMSMMPLHVSIRAPNFGLVEITVTDPGGAEVFHLPATACTDCPPEINECANFVAQPGMGMDFDCSSPMAGAFQIVIEQHDATDNWCPLALHYSIEVH